MARKELHIAGLVQSLPISATDRALWLCLIPMIVCRGLQTFGAGMSQRQRFLLVCEVRIVKLLTQITITTIHFTDGFRQNPIGPAVLFNLFVTRGHDKSGQYLVQDMYRRAQSDSEYGRPLVRISYNIIGSSCMMSVTPSWCDTVDPCNQTFLYV